MGRRKGWPRIPKDFMYQPFGPAHPVARAIADRSHWFEAWCFQNTLTWSRLKQATGIAAERARDLARGAPITRAELDALAKACGVQPADIIASLPDPALLED